MVAIQDQSCRRGLVPMVKRDGTQGRLRCFFRMNRRDQIKLTLERIKVARKLVAQQTEYIRLAKAVGYEPVHGAAVLRRFRTQLSDQRAALLRLTRGARTRPLFPPIPARSSHR